MCRVVDLSPPICVNIKFGSLLKTEVFKFASFLTNVVFYFCFASGYIAVYMVAS